MEIGELALEVWQSGMIAPLGQRLVKLLLEAIDQDRSQQPLTIPIEAVRGTIISFVEVIHFILTLIFSFIKKDLHQLLLTGSGL